MKRVLIFFPQSFLGNEYAIIWVFLFSESASIINSLIYSCIIYRVDVIVPVPGQGLWTRMEIQEERNRGMILVLVAYHMISNV